METVQPWTNSANLHGKTSCLHLYNENMINTGSQWDDMKENIKSKEYMDWNDKHSGNHLSQVFVF